MDKKNTKKRRIHFQDFQRNQNIVTLKLRPPVVGESIHRGRGHLELQGT